MIQDQQGNKVDTGNLTEPQTAKIMTVQHQWHDIDRTRGLTPQRLRDLFLRAAQGDLLGQSELFEDMLEKDSHLYAEMDKRKTAPLNIDWSIMPPRNASAAEKKLAAYAEEVIRDLPDFEDLIKAMMDGVGHGFSAIELEWHKDGDEWLPKFLQRPQSWFQLPIDRSSIRLRDGTMNGAELQPFGWIFHQHGIAKTGYLGRFPMYRVLAVPFLYKLYAMNDFAEFLETYGLPIIMGKYAQGATDKQQQSLLRAVQALGHDARGIMPADMAIEIEAVQSSSSALHMVMAEYCDKAISKAILGGTLSSQADGKTSTNALGTIHDEVRRDIARSDCLQIAGTATRDLIYPLLMINKSGLTSLRRCPRMVFDTSEAEDMALYSDALPKLISVGMKIPTRYAHDKLKIPLPEADEDILSTPKAAPNTQTAALSVTRVTSNPQFTAKQQEIENLVDDTLANVLSPIDPKIIYAALSAATDFDDLANRLAVLIGSDSSEFERYLQQATFAADTIGFAHAV